MKRPWQIWTLYVVCLAAVLPAMGWLTTKSLQLDRAEALAQRQAELEERIASALWRIDTELTRILAPEIARPYFVYDSFYTVHGADGQPQQIPSPLLMQPSEFVLLHFQISPNGGVTSPQLPIGAQCALALEQGVSQDALVQNGLLVEQLGGIVDRETLLACLPQQTVPQMDWDPNYAANNYAQLKSSNPKVVKNTADVESVKRRFDQLDERSSQLQQQAVQSPFPNAPAYNAQRAQQLEIRLGTELQNRDASLQAAAQQEFVQQRMSPNAQALLQAAQEGVSQPIWIDSRLVLARRVELGGEVVVQGCWLDWPRIEQHLVALVGDTLPTVRFAAYTESVNDANAPFNRLLATLPVQLVVAAPVATADPWSPIRLSLLIAWGFLFLAAAAVGLLLQGVITLSERRGAFVSAVTHELRTPLTTFRMYTEMLAEGMAPPERRQAYLHTLRIEADRLAHLVENVLQYARLERGGAGCRRQQVSLEALLSRFLDRLADRAAQAEMQLVVETEKQDLSRVINTDPSAVEQILFNLVDNACKYAAAAEDRRIQLRVRCSSRAAEFAVEDHGPGISAAQARKLFRPFSKSVEQAANSAAGVGLGLALCRRLTRDLGGRLELQQSTSGASFVLTLPLTA